MTTNFENKKEKREYGSISYNVYWQYLKVIKWKIFSRLINICDQISNLGWWFVVAWYFPYSQCCSSEYEGCINSCWCSIILTFWKILCQVYLDFLLGNWVEGEDESAENIREFYKIFCCLSLTIIVLTYFYNILGQWIGSCLRLPTTSYISSTQKGN